MLLGFFIRNNKPFKSPDDAANGGEGKQNKTLKTVDVSKLGFTERRREETSVR